MICLHLNMSNWGYSSSDIKIQRQSVLKLIYLGHIDTSIKNCPLLTNIFRVDILHPPTIQRRTVALETDIQSQHNHNRSRGMQHKMYMDYMASRKPAFYGKVFNVN